MPDPIDIDFQEEIRSVIDQRKREPVLVEREKTHGRFNEQGAWAHRTKQLLRGTPNFKHLTGSQAEALEMCITKISRILYGDSMHKDTWDDLAGYAKLGAEACE